MLSKDAQLRIRRPLGRTDLSVFPLGLGGHTYPVGEAGCSTDPCYATPDQRAELVATLVSGGVNYFDTTWMNEAELLADSLRRAALDPRELVISLQYVDGLSEPDWPAHLRQELEQRLALFGYSQAPLFLMGVGNRDLAYADLLAGARALAALQAEGLVANIGLSCHSLPHMAQIARLIDETDLLDYVMIRYNWKFRQAAESLFPTLEAHNVGLVLMKTFCWDCGPGHWDYRISVFDPIDEAPAQDLASLTPAQRALIWSLQNAPAATTVISTNNLVEARENLAAMAHLDAPLDETGLAGYTRRLDDPAQLTALAQRAQASVIRQRARTILAKRQGA